ncbi:nipped-B-like protein A [Brachyhypopomus gauderio]|uniref:nipped-B-like protein A n=1 Tax=Brachyhypopomus gauderio TaxID=698409 RepID=UPI0040420B2C
MEHLDPDEEEEVGENAAAVRNKAISALLEGTGGAKLHNHHQAQMDEYDSEGDERTAGVSGRGRKAGESADAVLANMSLSVSALDIVALHCPQYRNRPQLGRVLERTATACAGWLGLSPAPGAKLVARRDSSWSPGWRPSASPTSSTERSR